MSVDKTVLHTVDNGLAYLIIAGPGAQHHLQVQGPVIIESGLQHAGRGNAHLVACFAEQP